MNYVVERADGLERDIKICIPTNEITPIITKKLKDLQPKINISGFRPGKVPYSVIEQRYGESVRSESVKEIMEKYIQEVVKKMDVSLLDSPIINSYDEDNSSEVVFKISFEVRPEIKLIDIKELKAEKFVCEILDDDVSFAIEMLRKQQSNWVDANRKSEKNDKLYIDFMGTIDGNKFDGGSAKNFEIILGEGRMLKQFEESLFGVTKGDNKKITVTFPNEYNAALAGKTAVFDITILKVLSPELPTMDQDFVKMCKIPSGDVAELKIKIKETLQKQATEQTHLLLKDELIKQILARHDFDLPKKLINKETDRMKSQYKDLYQGNKPKDNVIDEKIYSEAERRIKLNLLVEAYINKYKIKLDNNKANEQIVKHAQMTQDPEKELREISSDRYKIKHFQYLAMQESLFDEMFNNSTCQHNKISYNEIMVKTQMGKQ